MVGRPQVDAPSDVVGVSEAGSSEQSPDERPTNRTRRFQPRKSPRAKFPLITAEPPRESVRGAGLADETGLDTHDPAAGGGRGFQYQWEDTAQHLTQEIAAVASGGGISYVHTQSVPAATWVIDHHMGLIPNVVLLDDSGQQMFAEIHQPSDQTTVVVHSAPYSGTAYLRP